jgi:hypothetical protein
MRIWGFVVIVLTRTTPTKGSVREELKGDLLLASNLKNDTNDSDFHMTKLSIYIRNDVSRICQSNHNLIHMNGHVEPSTPCKMDGVWLENT